MARATTQRAEAILPARWSAELQRQWWQRTPAPLAQLLRPLSWLYAVAFAVVRRLIRPVALPVPVVVVGNLVVGGAGKTPTVMAVVQLLRAFGWTPGVVSRGHGRESNQRLAVTRESLASQGFTQEMFAARCSVRGLELSRATLSKVEARLRCVTDQELAVFAEALRVDIKTLYPAKRK